ncbi:MAG: hypothetical protein PHI19_00250 [Clostridia bacterium]|nr:hypothetical protein [Clostridia bacterium]
MYSKSENGNYVTYFEVKDAKNTDKVFHGRVSESIKGKPKEDGKHEWTFETWSARFVGGAYEKAKMLSDKASIRLTEYNVRKPYSKEKKSSYPYILIMDFEVVGVSPEAPEVPEDEVMYDV